MKIVAIIQARMGSTRLPGKILKKVLNKSLLEYQLERVGRSNLINQIIVATTTNTSEEPIIQLCNSLSIPVFRGSEDDVLSRYYQAAIEHDADIIVRITSDCPIIDWNVIDKVTQTYLEGHYDYVSNSLERTYPRGMDTEVFSFRTLEEMFNEANKEYFREHVTPFIYQNPNRYKLRNISYHEDYSKHRWTVDTIEDYNLIRLIIEHLYPTNHKFKLEDILELMKKYPHWLEINAHIEQKKIGE